MALFVKDRDFERKLLASGDVEAMLLGLAQKAAKAAKRYAPTRFQFYRESIEGIAGIGDDGKARGRVLSEDYKAWWIEAGTGQPFPTRAYAPLRRGVEEVVGPLGG